jgi:protein-L-isoaspartate(D-aspartate) O-methyltransferase
MANKLQKSQLLNTLKQDGINDEAVLRAIADTPREYFVESKFKQYAYDNTALPIACGQTISQPYVVAHMTQLLHRTQRLHKVLEVGTGSGYQAAVLSHLVDEVYTIERVYDLYQQARQRLLHLGYDNIWLGYQDGFKGWSEHAPYDGILVTAACEQVPPALLSQLSDEGVMIVPVGPQKGPQYIYMLQNSPEGVCYEIIESVMFVPLKANKN